MEPNPSDELCFRYFAFHRKIKELTHAMFKFCCPRTLSKVPGCPENVYEFQTYTGTLTYINAPSRPNRATKQFIPTPRGRRPTRFKDTRAL